MLLFVIWAVVSAVAAFLALGTHVLLFCSVFTDIVRFCVSKINWWWWWWKSKSLDVKNLQENDAYLMFMFNYSWPIARVRRLRRPLHTRRSAVGSYKCRQLEWRLHTCRHKTCIREMYCVCVWPWQERLCRTWLVQLCALSRPLHPWLQQLVNTAHVPAHLRQTICSLIHSFTHPQLYSLQIFTYCCIGCSQLKRSVSLFQMQTALC